MHNILYGFCLFVLLSSSVSAQDRKSVAVIDLDGVGISEQEVKIISSRLRTEIFNTSKYKVIEREKMEDILVEQGFQMSGCTSNECAIEVGKLIGVEQIVAGSVGKIGSLYTINLRIIDVTTGQVLKTATEDCQCLIETVLTGSVGIAARTLVEAQSENIADNKKTLLGAGDSDQSQILKEPVTGSNDLQPKKTYKYSKIIDDLMGTIKTKNFISKINAYKSSAKIKVGAKSEFNSTEGCYVFIVNKVEVEAAYLQQAMNYINLYTGQKISSLKQYYSGKSSIWIRELD